MKKESPKSLSKSEAKNLEASHLYLNSRERASEASGGIAFSWLEDIVIQKKASVELGKDDTGKETATIKMLDPKTQKEETIYYTANQGEVLRFKKILEGKSLVTDFSKDGLLE